ncbi:MAG: hypothetical protein J6P87_04080, partial [Lachnospiraceae bacterium]|nr:hypothetical protein [Lachnospiraceae bacterium]
MKDETKEMQNEAKEVQDIVEAVLDEEIASHSEEAGGGKKKKKHRVGPAIWLLLAALVVVFIFSTYHFVSEFMAYKRARDEYSGLASYISIAPGSGTDAAVQDGSDKDASGEAAPSGSPDGSSADSLLPVDDQGNALTKSSTPGIFRAGTL